MADNIYHDLRHFLDQFPFGYPETESGIEIEILKRLFTEDEAELALKLTVIPEEVESISKRTGLPSDELHKRLEEMAQKGLVFRISRHEKNQYNAIPFVVGLYEYSVKKMDSELAGLCREYVDTVYMDEIGATDIPSLKVVPIGTKIGAGTELLPYHNIVENVRKAKRIAVAECICRKEKRLLGEGCTHPLEACLTFGITADYYIESGMGREISAEEAIQIIEEADKSGLVHTATNTRSMSMICNCCPCCCPFMIAITKSANLTSVSGCPGSLRGTCRPPTDNTGSYLRRSQGVGELPCAMSTSGSANWDCPSTRPRSARTTLTPRSSSASPPTICASWA